MEPTEGAVIVAVPEAEDVVGPQRAALDRAASWGVPAHVTVLYPFVPPAKIDDRIIRALARRFANRARVRDRLSSCRVVRRRGRLAGARARPTVPGPHQRCLGPLPRLPAVPRKACRADSAPHHRETPPPSKPYAQLLRRWNRTCPSRRTSGPPWSSKATTHLGPGRPSPNSRSGSHNNASSAGFSGTEIMEQPCIPSQSAHRANLAGKSAATKGGIRHD